MPEIGPELQQRLLACVQRLHQVGPIPVVEIAESHSAERRPVCETPQKDQRGARNELDIDSEQSGPQDTHLRVQHTNSLSAGCCEFKTPCNFRCLYPASAFAERPLAHTRSILVVLLGL